MICHVKDIKALLIISLLYSFFLYYIRSRGISLLKILYNYFLNTILLLNINLI